MGLWANTVAYWCPIDRPLDPLRGEALDHASWLLPQTTEQLDHVGTKAVTALLGRDFAV